MELKDISHKVNNILKLKAKEKHFLCVYMKIAIIWPKKNLFSEYHTVKDNDSWAKRNLYIKRHLLLFVRPGKRTERFDNYGHNCWEHLWLISIIVYNLHPTFMMCPIHVMCIGIGLTLMKMHYVGTAEGFE